MLLLRDKSLKGALMHALLVCLKNYRSKYKEHSNIMCQWYQKFILMQANIIFHKDLILKVIWCRVFFGIFFYSLCLCILSDVYCYMYTAHMEFSSMVNCNKCLFSTLKYLMRKVDLQSFSQGYETIFCYSLKTGF